MDYHASLGMHARWVHTRRPPTLKWGPEDMISQPIERRCLGCMIWRHPRPHWTTQECIRTRPILVCYSVRGASNTLHAGRQAGKKPCLHLQKGRSKSLVGLPVPGRWVFDRSHLEKATPDDLFYSCILGPEGLLHEAVSINPSSMPCVRASPRSEQRVRLRQDSISTHYLKCAGQDPRTSCRRASLGVSKVTKLARGKTR
jgi:hypothetical protein